MTFWNSNIIKLQLRLLFLCFYGRKLDDRNTRKLGGYWHVHSTTGEKPFDRLPLEGLRKLPPIPYYEENTINVQKDGSVYFHGRVYHVDESLAGCSGEVIDLEDTLFAKIDGRSFILGVRDLPVYIRKRYSRTKQTVHGQKRRKYKTGTLDKWLPKLYENVKAGWRCSCA